MRRLAFLERQPFDCAQGTTYTAYQFTGQRNETALGLYFYNARWPRSAPAGPDLGPLRRREIEDLRSPADFGGLVITRPAAHGFGRISYTTYFSLSNISVTCRDGLQVATVSGSTCPTAPRFLRMTT